MAGGAATSAMSRAAAQLVGRWDRSKYDRKSVARAVVYRLFSLPCPIFKLIREPARQG